CQAYFQINAIRRIDNLSIKQKLILLTMFASGVALSLACAAFLIYEQMIFRQSMSLEFAILADMFDDAVAPGLEFDDTKSIEHALSTLKANPHIMAACVFNSAGKIAVTYERPYAKAPFRFPVMQSTGQNFDDNRLNTYRDIILAGEK